MESQQVGLENGVHRLSLWPMLHWPGLNFEAPLPSEGLDSTASIGAFFPATTQRGQEA